MEVGDNVKILVDKLGNNYESIGEDYYNQSYPDNIGCVDGIHKDSFGVGYLSLKGVDGKFWHFKFYHVEEI